jgi:hypothetical protein
MDVPMGDAQLSSARAAKVQGRPEAGHRYFILTTKGKRVGKFA